MIDYVRTFARIDEVSITNNGNQTSVPRSEEPLRMWLRLPDNEQGEQKLMEYNWDSDSWSEYIPQE